MSLVVSGVSHGYGVRRGRVEVLHDVSVTVVAGEVVALTGPSGSGKTTLCHLAAGLEAPEHGTVELSGTPVRDLAAWDRVAVVPQQHGLLAGLTAADNIRLPVLRAGRSDLDLDALAEALDLTAFLDRDVTDASLGEQQRTAVARALALRPELAVLDEPTGHQDDDHVVLVVAAIRAAAVAGSAVLVASHDARVWEAADRVVRLADGRVAAPAPGAA